MTLALQQAQLLTALWQPWIEVLANQTLATQQVWPRSQYLRGLQAYRANAAVNAQNVLAGSYPVLKRLMGDEQFHRLAVHFWRIRPPIRGDLAQWGQGLDEFLKSNSELMAHEPYLPDLASLEWALNLGQTTPDAADDQAVPLTVIDSEYPIVDLHSGKEWSELANKAGQRALVYRQGFKTKCIAIPKEIAL